MASKRTPRRENIVVGLDIGTTKICAVVGEVTPEGVDIIGIGTAPSRGLRKGVVINIEATVAGIKKAVEEAELMAGCEIHSVYAGIAGGHIRGFNSHGIVAVKDREVTEADVERVIDAAKAVAIPVDREVIHILPQEFVIDDQDGIKEPLGMSGVRLEAKVHIVTGNVTSAQNIVKCAQRCALNVSDIVLELVDIGGGTTDIAIFHGGSIQHTSVVAIGGQHMTNDIAVGLRTPQEEAEAIKKRWGCASSKMIKAGEMIEVPSIGGRKSRELSRQILGDILEPRVVEIFELVQREIEKMKLTELLASGVVLTGGSCLLPGMLEVAEEVIGLPVRLGVPRHVGGLVDVVRSPVYSTGVGLLQYGAQQEMADRQHFRARDENIYTKVKKRMSAWLEDVL